MNYPTVDFAFYCKSITQLETSRNKKNIGEGVYNLTVTVDGNIDTFKLTRERKDVEVLIVEKPGGEWKMIKFEYLF